MAVASEPTAQRPAPERPRQTERASSISAFDTAAPAADEMGARRAGVQRVIDETTGDMINRAMPRDRASRISAFDTAAPAAEDTAVRRTGTAERTAAPTPTIGTGVPGSEPTQPGIPPSTGLPGIDGSTQPSIGGSGTPGLTAPVNPLENPGSGTPGSNPGLTAPVNPLENQGSGTPGTKVPVQAPNNQLPGPGGVVVAPPINQEGPSVSVQPPAVVTPTPNNPKPGVPTNPSAPIIIWTQANQTTIIGGTTYGGGNSVSVNVGEFWQYPQYMSQWGQGRYDDRRCYHHGHDYGHCTACYNEIRELERNQLEVEKDVQQLDKNQQKLNETLKDVKEDQQTLLESQRVLAQEIRQVAAAKGTTIATDKDTDKGNTWPWGAILATLGIGGGVLSTGYAICQLRGRKGKTETRGIDD